MVRRIATKERPSGELNESSEIVSNALDRGRQIVLGKGWREVQFVPENPYVSKTCLELPIRACGKVGKHESIPVRHGMTKERHQKVRNLHREKWENLSKFRRENKPLPNVGH